MSSTKKKTIGIGDCFRLKDAGREIIMHVTKKDQEYGERIGVLTPPRELTIGELGELNYLFQVYFPVTHAWKKGLLEWLGNFPVRSAEIIMRRPGKRDNDGRICNWFLVFEDGSEVFREKLSPQEKKLSLAVIWNDTMLVDMVNSGWKPDQEI